MSSLKTVKNPYIKNRAPEVHVEPQRTANTESASALVIAAADKAGMQGIDRKRIDEIILRESGNSLYMQQQRRRDAKVDERIESLRQKLSTAPRNFRSKLEMEINQEIPSILSSRSTRSTAVVVDMDMFYMACELLTRPDLQDKPACVGRGMILTSNYTARKYGVRSAMAGWIGDKLVQELSNGKETLIHLPSRHDFYREKSLQVREVLAEYDPNLRAYSLDEAYMELGPYLALRLTNPQWSHQEIREMLRTQENGSDDSQQFDETILLQFSASECLNVASVILQEMRKAVKERTGGLTCSAGLAPNHLLAKVASDMNKPDGQCIVGCDQQAVEAFLHPLSIRKVSGIGRVTEKILHAFGISSVRQLYEERALVRFLFHDATARFLLRASLGCASDRSGEEAAGQKGISRERTFTARQSSAELYQRLEEIGRLLASDMERKSIKALTLTVKVKLHTFDCLSKSKTVTTPLYEPQRIVDLAAELLREIRGEFEGNEFSVRLLGIRCSNFYKHDGQMTMEKFVKAEPGIEKHSPKARSPTLPVKKRPSVSSETQTTLDQFTDVTNCEPTAQKEVHCPICGQAFPSFANASLNLHVDMCLQTDDGDVATGKRRKRTIADFFLAS